MPSAQRAVRVRTLVIDATAFRRYFVQRAAVAQRAVAGLLTIIAGSVIFVRGACRCFHCHFSEDERSCGMVFRVMFGLSPPMATYLRKAEDYRDSPSVTQGRRYLSAPNTTELTDRTVLSVLQADAVDGTLRPTFDDFRSP